MQIGTCRENDNRGYTLGLMPHVYSPPLALPLNDFPVQSIRIEAKILTHGHFLERPNGEASLDTGDNTDNMQVAVNGVDLHSRSRQDIRGTLQKHQTISIPRWKSDADSYCRVSVEY
ncbi:uncharacterized protein [Prorops nasuta]|uniref:uncharacterized protein n=1 Tax=Prorops nasuta TaxID=863751 RepID=UPI0034CDF8E1